MSYWHMQLHEADHHGFSLDDIKEILKQKLIGCSGDPVSLFKQMALNDIVLVRHGGIPIALVSVTGQVRETKSAEASEFIWFSHCAEVKIIGYISNESISGEGWFIPRTLQRANGSIASIFINKYLKKFKMDNSVELLKYKKQIILQGPPGTGKTKLAKEIAEKLLEEQGGNDKSENLTRNEIIDLCSEIIAIPTAKTKLSFKILGVNDSGVRVENTEGSEYTAPFAEIIRMFDNKAWLKEGLIVNGTNSYSAAVAKYIFSIRKPSSDKVNNFKIIQFHPSYSYEDFVRGIVAESKGDKIEYKNVNKVLGQFAKAATENFELSKSENYDIQHDKWIEKAFEEFRQEIEIEIEQRELVLSGNIGIFIAESDCFRYGKDWGVPSRINFTEFKKLIKAVLNSEIQTNQSKLPKESFVHAHYRVTYYMALLRIFFERKKFIASLEKATVKNFVLIIDEINRANLSAVFGELIYALEYRGEKVESMYAINDKNEFMLPPNLYIIGTMNTADRSVGHIDYAIRRRFAFVDVLPKDLTSELEDDFKAEVYHKIANLFTSDFISSEFDAKDVQLGHSYFIQQYEKDASGNYDKSKPYDFKLRIQYEILPILKEYLKDSVFKSSAKSKIEEIENQYVS